MNTIPHLHFNGNCAEAFAFYARTLGGTVETFIEMVFNYPTLSEMFKYAAYDALGALAR